MADGLDAVTNGGSDCLASASSQDFKHGLSCQQLQTAALAHWGTDCRLAGQILRCPLGVQKLTSTQRRTSSAWCQKQTLLPPAMRGGFQPTLTCTRRQ